MIVIEGVINLHRLKGAEVLLVDDKPVAKSFSSLNEQYVKLHVEYPEDSSFTIEGVADIFYYEGSQEFFRGTKYASDFYIDDTDILEFLEKLIGKKVKIIMTTGTGGQFPCPKF